MKKICITCVGPDQSGIVAAITDVLANHQGNIEDTTMTILGCQFALIMIGVLPDSVTLDTLANEYRALERRMSLSVTLSTLDQAPGAEAPHSQGQPFMVSVAGNDRTGITCEITRILAHYAVNITDLNARTIPGESGPVYIMMVECLLPNDLPKPAFEQTLARMGETLNVEITYHPIEHAAL